MNPRPPDEEEPDGEPPPAADAEPPRTADPDSAAEVRTDQPPPPTEPSPLAEPPPPVPPPPARAKPPRVSETVAGSFDLALAASRQIRRVSVYVGILTLALIGPATILFLVIVRDQGSLEAAADLLMGLSGPFEPPEQGALTMLQVSLFCGFIGLFALLVEAQIIATAIIGGVAANRRIGVRDSLRLSRAVFWRVVAAAVLVGVMRGIVGVLTIAILDPRTETALEGAQIWELILEALVTAPFAYFLAGIVIGGVGPIETLRRSVRVARARWRLAIVVASAGAVIGFIQAFALGAGLDLLSRIATVTGLGLDGPPHMAVLTALLILAGVVAVGSLLVTITALTVAPQVYVFLKMTGYSGGLERAFPIVPIAGPPARRPRLVTWPMVILIALGGATALAGLTAL